MMRVTKPKRQYGKNELMPQKKDSFLKTVLLTPVSRCSFC